MSARVFVPFYRHIRDRVGNTGSSCDLVSTPPVENTITTITYYIYIHIYIYTGSSCDQISTPPVENTTTTITTYYIYLHWVAKNLQHMFKYKVIIMLVEYV